MKKRLLGFSLILCILFTVLPGFAFTEKDALFELDALKITVSPEALPSPKPDTPIPRLGSKDGSGNAPSPGAAISKENLLALLDAYDPDGAYIIRNSSESFLSFWLMGNTLGDIVGSSLDTAVHEQCHDFTGSASGIRYNATTGRYMSSSERIYIGGKNYITVPFTEVFDSREMVSAVPASLRTSRFTTYIDTGEDATASRQHGIYGILNEFTAYCWGLNTTMRVLPYANQYGLRNGMNSNTYVSYAEFRYYILQYMLYAKEHYPAVYTGIMNNSEFLSAVRIVESKFRGIVEEFRSKSSTTYFDSEYLPLMNKMKESKYVAMAKLLFEGSGSSASYTNVLRLPSHLKEIQSQAFTDVSAEAVVIPDSVTSIADDAFGTIVIIGTPGTAAETYARSHGLTFVDVSTY